MSAYPVILVAVPVEHISPTEVLFAKAWSGCSLQHIPSCKGAFHDVASTTIYLGYAEAGEPQLAAQVPSLRIFERCRCGDDICSTLYTQLPPKGSYGPGHRNVRLFPEDDALLVLDVVDGKIACVELLDREDVRRKLKGILS